VKALFQCKPLQVIGVLRLHSRLASRNGYSAQDDNVHW